MKLTPVYIKMSCFYKQLANTIVPCLQVAPSTLNDSITSFSDHFHMLFLKKDVRVSMIMFTSFHDHELKRNKGGQQRQCLSCITLHYKLALRNGEILNIFDIYQRNECENEYSNVLFEEDFEMHGIARTRGR